MDPYVNVNISAFCRHREGWNGQGCTASVAGAAGPRVLVTTYNLL